MVISGQSEGDPNILQRGWYTVFILHTQEKNVYFDLFFYIPRKTITYICISTVWFVFFYIWGGVTPWISSAQINSESSVGWGSFPIPYLLYFSKNRFCPTPLNGRSRGYVGRGPGQTKCCIVNSSCTGKFVGADAQLLPTPPVTVSHFMLIAYLCTYITVQYGFNFAVEWK